MLRADIELTFLCYVDDQGMMMYVSKPVPKQEGEPDDKQEEIKEFAPKAGETNQAEILDKMVLTGLEDGLFTGKKLAGRLNCSKDVMSDILNAEKDGMRPCFTLSIKA